MTAECKCNKIAGKKSLLIFWDLCVQDAVCISLSSSPRQDNLHLSILPSHLMRMPDYQDDSEHLSRVERCTKLIGIRNGKRQQQLQESIILEYVSRRAPVPFLSHRILISWEMKTDVERKSFKCLSVHKIGKSACPLSSSSSWNESSSKMLKRERLR